MAVYTVELGELLRAGYQLDLNRYPLFMEEYRPFLNQKIIDHFWFREIGAETPDRFNFYLGRTMNELMPYYNKLYESECIKYDPLATDYFAEKESHAAENDRTRTDKGKTRTGDTTGEVFTGNVDTKTVGNIKNNLNENIGSHSVTTNDLKSQTDSTTHNTTDTTSKTIKNTIFSDVPQAGITTTVTENADGSITTESTGYATTTTNENTNSTTNSESDTTAQSVTTNTGTVTVDGTSSRTNDETTDATDYTLSKEDTERNITHNQKSDRYNTEKAKELQKSDTSRDGKGRRGFSPAALIREYRQTLLNIDMMIINDLEKLFMGVY